MTGEELKRMRLDAGLSRAEAAKMIGLSHANRIGEIERDEAPMDEARLELLRIKLGLHPLYGPLTPSKS